MRSSPSGTIKARLRLIYSSGTPITLSATLGLQSVKNAVYVKKGDFCLFLQKATFILKSKI
jgi:hypothetical protein